MRDGINDDEGWSLVKALKAGRSWDEVRGMIPGVDPAALDRGWKTWCLKQAGLALDVPVPAEVPVVEAPPVEIEEQRTPRKRRK